MSEINTTAMAQLPSNTTSYDPELWRSSRIQSAEWIASQCIAVTVTFFALYLVTALSYYEMQKRGILSSSGIGSEYSVTEHSMSKTSSPSKHMVHHHSPKNHDKSSAKRKRRSKQSHEERYESWLRLLNLSAAVFAMLKCFSIQIDLVGGTFSRTICFTYAFSTIMLNGSSFLSVYLLLWLRQWAVHSHPALQHLPVKKLRLISWIILAAMLVTFASLCIMFFITINVKHGPRGCVFADEGTISQGVRSGSGIIFTGLFQPALFCLMCYPLMKHTFNRRRAFGIGSKEDRHRISRPLDEGEEKIYKIIRRLLISVVLVTISDIGGVVGAFLLEDHPIFYIGQVYDINITFGAYVITWSFNNWKQRLLPFWKQTKAEQVTPTVSNETNA